MKTNVQLVYDGDCGLCRACVEWVKRHDVKNRIEAFAASDCAWLDAESQPFSDTVVVRRNGDRTFYRSSAIAEVLVELSGMWVILGQTLRFANKMAPIRWFHDFLYSVVSKNRRTISNLLVKVHVLDSSCQMPSRSK